MPAIFTGDWIPSSSLAIGTYHQGFGAEASLVQSYSAFWDAVTVGIITFWTSDFPMGRVPINDVVAGHWIQQQPPTALGGYTAVSPAGAATLGASPLIITIPGGTAGGINVQFGNISTRHIKALVTIATAGAYTYCFHGKD
jgi:hypothetical protein